MNNKRAYGGLLLPVVLLIGADAFQNDTRSQQPQPEVLQTVKAFKSQYLDGNKLLMTLSSEEMIPIDKDNLKLVKPTATIYHEPKEKGQAVTKIDVASMSGTFHIPTRKMHLTESVVVQTSGGARLETLALDLDGANKVTSTEEAFRYSEPGVELRGKGFEMNHDQRTLWVKKDLQGKLTQDPRQRNAGTERKQENDRAEVVEFRSRDGLRRAPLDAAAAKEKGASERYELLGDVHLDRTQAIDAVDQKDQLSAEFVEFFMSKPDPAQEKPEGKSSITELHARDRVQVASPRGGTVSGDDLTWHERDDVMHVVGNPTASGSWGKNIFSAKRIHLDRRQGIMQCQEQASVRMEPEKEGQNPMTIEADHVVARVGPSSEAEPRTVLKDFVAEKEVVLRWSDPAGSNASGSSSGGELSRALGQKFVWNPSEGQGVLEDTPFARVIQSGNVIESPRMVIYNEPMRVILKGPKRLKVNQPAAEGNKEYTITSTGDMIMDPVKGRIQMLRDVTMTGTDIHLVSDAMDITLSEGENKTIKLLEADGRVHLENRVQKVKLSGDHLNWDPATTTMIVTGTPFAYVSSPDGDIRFGEIHYNEKTGQMEGRRGKTKGILNLSEQDEQKKRETDHERRPQ